MGFVSRNIRLSNLNVRHRSPFIFSSSNPIQINSCWKRWDSSNLYALTGEEFPVSSFETFEPVLDGSAAFSFALIAVLFTSLITRARKVEDAAMKRKAAVEKLRVARTKELSDGIDASIAIRELEDALKEEEELRTVIPGVRIRAPGSLQNSDKDQVKQLLKDNVPDIINIGQSENDELEGGISNGSKLLLGGIIFSQLFLLYILSFDPMEASTLFTSLNGPPPDNLPFSSW